MKSFIFTVTEHGRRKVGGLNYTVKVWEVKSKTDFILIGERSANTAAHKGEPSEAWTLVFDSLSKRKQNEIKNSKEGQRLGLDNYYSWNYTPELFNIQLKQIS